MKISRGFFAIIRIVSIKVYSISNTRKFCCTFSYTLLTYKIFIRKSNLIFCNFKSVLCFSWNQLTQILQFYNQLTLILHQFYKNVNHFQNNFLLISSIQLKRLLVDPAPLPFPKASRTKGASDFQLSYTELDF